MYLDELLESINSKLDQNGRDERRGSKYVGPNADASLAEHVARGGTVERESAFADMTRTARRGGGAHTLPNGWVKTLIHASFGDAAAQDRMRKGWVEGVDSAGGYMVETARLPGYIAARRGAAPLRDRVAVRQVESNEVLVVVEGNTITVEWTPEATTKPASTGSVAVKLSSIYKAAGITWVSEELAEDTSGAAEELVERQFGVQVGLKINQAMLDGDGINKPTGILRAAGVDATAVDGPAGDQIYTSIIKAISRLNQKFYEVKDIVVHPSTIAKFALARDAENRFLFPQGLNGLFPEQVVTVDPSMPVVAGNTQIVVGNLAEATVLLERTPLVIEASREAGWTTDEIGVRGHQRIGFGVLVPGALERLINVPVA